MSEERFWRMTPRDFARLHEQHEARERREWQRTAYGLACVANMTAPREDKKAWQPDDFMPEFTAQTGGSRRRLPEPGKRAPEPWETMKAKLMGLAAAGYGEFRDAPEKQEVD